MFASDNWVSSIASAAYLCQRYHGCFVVRFIELCNTAAAKMLAIQRQKMVVYLCALFCLPRFT